MIRPEDLAALPEAVKRGDDGAGEEVVQDWLHDLWDFCPRQCRLVTKVRELPGPGNKVLILEQKLIK